MNWPAKPIVRQEPEILRSIANAHINWVLDHPHMSPWLKETLRSAQGLDPVALQNDIEMLRHLIGLRANAEVEIAVNHATAGAPVVPAAIE